MHKTGYSDDSASEKLKKIYKVPDKYSADGGNVQFISIYISRIQTFFFLKDFYRNIHIYRERVNINKYKYSNSIRFTIGYYSTKMILILVDCVIIL